MTDITTSPLDMKEVRYIDLTWPLLMQKDLVRLIGATGADREVITPCSDIEEATIFCVMILTKVCSQNVGEGIVLWEGSSKEEALSRFEIADRVFGVNHA